MYMHELSYPATSGGFFLAWFLACTELKVVRATNIRRDFGLLTRPILAGQTTFFSHSKTHVDENLCMLAG